MNQKLDGYETVKERKKRFRVDNPDARIETELVFQEDGHAIIKAMVFKNADEQMKRLPFGTGYAEEFKGQGGFANKFSWMENCEESAVGRALDNAGYAGSCSREEMEKVERGENNGYANEPKKPVKTALSRDDLEKQFLQATSKEVCRDNYKAVRVMNLKEDDKRHLYMVIEARAKELEEVQ